MYGPPFCLHMVDQTTWSRGSSHKLIENGHLCLHLPLELVLYETTVVLSVASSSSHALYVPSRVILEKPQLVQNIPEAILKEYYLGSCVSIGPVVDKSGVRSCEETLPKTPGQALSGNPFWKSCSLITSSFLPLCLTNVFLSFSALRLALSMIAWPVLTIAHQMAFGGSAKV